VYIALVDRTLLTGRSMILVRVNALLLIVAVLTVAGCGSSDSRTTGRTGGGEALSVEAILIRPQPLEDKFYTTGTLMANEEVELRPEVSGRVMGVYFEEGSRVNDGDVLLQMNDRELQAELKRKQLEESLAAQEESRARALHEIRGISQEEYDKVLNTLNLKKAERDVIESQIAKTRIVAPMSGVVGLRYVSEGSFVSPTSIVATMQDIDTLKVEFSVPEKYAGRLASGTRIKVTVGNSAEAIRGVVYAVESKVEQTTRTLKARAVMANPGGSLIPGSFARVEITLQRIDDAIVIPTGAILPELEGERVFVCENGRARSVPVTTGIRTERSIQIVEGLKPNDTLIATGLLQVADGKPVQISKLTN